MCFGCITKSYKRYRISRFSVRRHRLHCTVTARADCPACNYPDCTCVHCAEYVLRSRHRFVSSQDLLRNMRLIDDRVVHALNTKIPTRSFVGEVDAAMECKALYNDVRQDVSITIPLLYNILIYRNRPN